MNISIKFVYFALGLHLLWGVESRVGIQRRLQVTQEAPRESVIERSYIVELKGGGKSAKQDVMQLASSYMNFDYSNVMDGFSIKNVPEEVLDSLLNSPDVEAIYEDVQNELYQDNQFVQQDAPWGLDRIDARSGLDGTYRYEFTGKDVTIFIVDSGVLSSHSDFSGRFWGCRDFVGTSCRSPGLHGTHVAGSAAGTRFGVAKEAQIADFKVCDSRGVSCPTSAIIAAFDEIVARKNSGGGEFVANLSLGGPRSTLLNNAATKAANAGVVVIVAAGNSNSNACNFSPASAAGVITVGSTTISDSRSSFSNFGSCVDVFAPGSNIESASSSGGSTTLSGTSMAAPHVSGIAALFLSEGQNAANEIIKQATTNVISNAGGGSPNRLVFTGIGTSPFPAPPPTTAPLGDPVSGGTPGCFSGSSLVSVLGKGPTKMVDLKIRDKVLTSQGYEPIYSFAHNDTSTLAEFLQLETTDGKMEVTGEHLLYLFGKTNPVRADSLQVGDSLHTHGGSASVTKISAIQKSGLHAPLTRSGTVFVDGILASCYISFFPEKDPETLDGLLSHHNFAHLGLSLLRTGCSSVSSSFCRSYNEAGVLSFVQFGASLFEYVSFQPPFVQRALLMAYVMVLTPLYIMESLFSGSVTRLLVLFGCACIFWLWWKRQPRLRKNMLKID